MLCLPTYKPLKPDLAHEQQKQTSVYLPTDMTLKSNLPYGHRTTATNPCVHFDGQEIKTRFGIWTNGAKMGKLETGQVKEVGQQTSKAVLER